MRGFIFTVLVFIVAAFTSPVNVLSQELDRPARGSIPEVLLRPTRGEAPRYPIDIVIGELGRGQATEAAFNFARSVCEGLLSGEMRHSALSSISASLRESYLSALEIISPLTFRIGGGKEEVDGAFSFLVRFIGRDMAITGELYIRLETLISENRERTTGNWIFEELLLEEAKDRETENQESIYRNDFNPYERFF